MAILNIAGGGKQLSYVSETPGPAVAMAGTRTYWNWMPFSWPDQHTMWPTAYITIQDPTSVQTANASRDSRTTPVAPIYYPRADTNWIWYSWDLEWLTQHYGPSVSNITTVTIPIVGVSSNGTRFGEDPWLSGTPTAHDLLACVPPAVQSATDLEWRDFQDNILVSSNTVDWITLSHDISGGTAAFPARPFPNVIGPGGWTQLSSYHTDDDIQDTSRSTPAGAGTWVVPVDLTAHARNGHLVIMCAGLGQFTQNEALLTEAQQYDGNPAVGTTRFDTNESWSTGARAQLLWNSAPPRPDDLGLEGRVHFFRGGPGEIPLGVAGEVDSSGAGGP
jgi:hypothetical protein